ncbi:MAG: hypothetical protein J1G05_03980 [Clostridiales bacterium]|nr:hypothetical protein [Clostridiales bacterium]
MNKLNALISVSNQTALLTLLGVLIAFVVLLTTLGIVFIIALRRRRPIVKVVMTPEAKQREEENAAAAEAAAASVTEAADVTEMAATAPAVQPMAAAVPEAAIQPATAPQSVATPIYAEDKVIDKQVNEGYLVPVYMITAYENVYYSFSPYEISSQPHERYSAIRDNIQTYERVKERTSNKREGYRVGRVAASGTKNRVKQKKGIRIAMAKRKSV